MRVLLVADDCNPEWPSLPVVGYHTCRTIAERVETTVVTQIRNRPNLEKHGFGQARVEYVDSEYVAKPINALSRVLRGGTSTGWTLNVALNYPAYLAFEWEVWKRFSGDLHAGRFDVVQRITPMSPTLPSPLARWSPAPFVLGPLNGGLKWPREYYGELKREKEWMTHVRGAYRKLPYYRSTYADSAAILAAFPHTIADLPAGVAERVIDFPEVGFDPANFHFAERSDSPSLTFLFAGRLVPYKCADVAIEAFARRPELREHTLLVVGDGPERPMLEQIIAKHGLGERVQMLGWKTQAEVAKLLRSADVFVFPSIRELGAGVVVEAMACGLACLVVDYGGPGGLINDQTGRKVALRAKEQMIEDFAGQMEALARDPAGARRLGRAASDFVYREYSWERKAEKFLDVYDWVLGKRPDKPAFITS
jgi:glycosyltransferase involved in cell wall biosynthesis